MASVSLPGPAVPYIEAGSRKMHLEALFFDLKASGEAPWKQFNSFADLDNVHVGKLLHLLPSKASEAESELRNITRQKIIQAVCYIFAGLACLTLIALGALALGAMFPISVPLAAVAIGVGVAGISILIPAAIRSFRKQQTQSRLSLLIKESPIWTNAAYSDSCKLADAYRFTKSQKIAASEYLAHERAYEDLQEGQIIPIREQTQQITYAKVSKCINREGFVCFLLTPLQERQYLKSFPIWEVFRGTHDMKSMRRLPEALSAGHSSYKLYEEELIDSKAALVPNDALAIVEKKCGHSLGGADAQRSVATTAGKIAGLLATNNNAFHPAKTGSLKPLNGKVCTKKATDSYLSRIRRIEVHMWNSAGIAHETNDAFKEAVVKINDAAKQGKIPACEISISACKVGGDGIQRTGQVTLGKGIAPGEPNVFREMHKFQHGFEGFMGFLQNWGQSTAKAHTIKNLNRNTNGGKDPAHSYLNSKTDFAALEQDNSDHITVGGAFWEEAKSFLGAQILGQSPGL